MLRREQKMITLITCEIPFGQYVCELGFGVNFCDLDLGVQIDSIEQPIKRNSVGSGNMSHCRASSLYDHLNHCFVVFEHMQQSFLMRRIDVWGKKENRHYPNHWSHSTSKVWLWVQRDGGIWSFPTWTRSRLSLHRHPEWVVRSWKTPFWFSKKVNITLSLKWSMPYQSGCSQVLISSRGFDSSICDWNNKFSLFGKYHLFRIESFRVGFRCVHRFQLLNVYHQYVILPNPSPRTKRIQGNNPGKTFFPNWWILDWSVAEFG